MGEISAAKGLGRKITAILFEGNVVTAENVITQGVKGLTTLPGIGPKKAASILSFAEKIGEKIIEESREGGVKSETDEETQIEDTSSDYDKEKLQERVAKLAGGVAVIKVGAGSEVEMKEKKARVEDALHSTRAAVEEGVVAGGGVALVRALQKIEGLKGDNEDQNVGINIALRAMETPLRQIISNAGEESSVVLDKIKAGKGNYGFNAQTGEYGDMIEMGILDPAKVTRTALQAAGSVAGLMVTTEAMISDLPEENAAPPGMPPGMDGMGGMGGMM